MKANVPSLISYFVSCTVYICFGLTAYADVILYSKAVIIPSIFVYYLISNNYKIDWVKGIILLLCFAGDMVVLFDFGQASITAVHFFFLVYFLLLNYILKDIKSVNFRKKHYILVTIIGSALIFLLLAVLEIQFSKSLNNFQIFIIYGITLLMLSTGAIANYISKGNNSAFQATLMVVCFIVSDTFFALNTYYLKMPVFQLITFISQVLSYYFMVNYFIESDKKTLIFKRR